jgi:hypothetical protein
MTFSTLMTQTNRSPSMTSDYMPSGTDEAEAERWKMVVDSYGVGETVNYADDIAEAGFTREENS